MRMLPSPEVPGDQSNYIPRSLRAHAPTRLVRLRGRQLRPHDQTRSSQEGRPVSTAYPFSIALAHLPPEMSRAIWEGDDMWLWENYPCQCCCHEHTFGPGCPAYQWGGCRGQGTMTSEEEESWARHYERFHGMTREEFFSS